MSCLFYDSAWRDYYLLYVQQTVVVGNRAWFSLHATNYEFKTSKMLQNLFRLFIN